MQVGAYSTRFRRQEAERKIAGTAYRLVNLVDWVDFAELVDWEITG